MERGSQARTRASCSGLCAGADHGRSPDGGGACRGIGPVIVERSAPGIEVELVGGRRVRFERDADPETVRRLVALLEGGAP